MIEDIHIDLNSEVPKYRQIEQVIEKGVTDGLFSKKTKLPSINAICSKFSLSRDTVVKAYNVLRERGIIESTHGKGYFISGLSTIPKKKVFVLFNELNAYKEVLHKSFVKALSEDVEVETFFHHHNIEVFEYLVEKALGKYTHYVIMPTFNAHQNKVMEVVKKIPQKKLYLIDRNLPNIECGSVFQDFRTDAYYGFSQLENFIRKYKKVTVFYRVSDMHPYASVEGIQQFCTEKNIEVIEASTIKEVITGMLYITFKDTDLVELVKTANQKGLSPSIEYGIISYNDSPLKEIIHQGITVISTDFEAMGRSTSKMIIENTQASLANPLKVIKRHSV